MNFDTTGLQTTVSVADDVVVPAEIAARFRGWERKGSSPSGFPLYRVRDDHRQCIVHVKWARWSPAEVKHAADRTTSSSQTITAARDASGAHKSQEAEGVLVRSSFPSPRASSSSTATASLASATKAGATKRLPRRTYNLVIEETSPTTHEGRQDRARDILRDNVALQLQLKHVRIAPLHQAIFTSRWMITVAPELTGGTLVDRLRFGEGAAAVSLSECTPWSEYTVACIIRAVLEGLQYVHREGLRYGTVHPSSLLYASASSRTDDLMLSTFSGTCAVSSPGETFTSRNNRDMRARGLRFGSVPFLSPEEVVEMFPFLAAPRLASSHLTPDTNEVGCASDMWGVGVLAFYLMTGAFPFVGRSQFSTLAAIASRGPCSSSDGDAVGEDERETCRRRHERGFSADQVMRTTAPFVWPTPDLTPEAIASCRGGERAYRESQLARGSPYAPALDFISLCCAADPAQRIAAAKALKHPWIACSDVAEQQSRVHPQTVLELLRSDRAGVAASRPQPLGRFADLAHEYEARCRRTTSQSSLALKVNSGLMELWTSPGSWAARESFVLDARNLRLGPVGCQAAVAAVVACAARSEGGNHPLRFVAMDLRDNGLDDDAVAALCVILKEPSSRRALRHLRRCDLRGNPRITNRGVRSLIQLLRVVKHSGDSCPGRSVEGANLRVAHEAFTRLCWDVQLDTPHIAPRLAAELSALRES